MWFTDGNWLHFRLNGHGASDHDCRHGRVFAISATSPDIEWSDLFHANQVINTSEVLEPQKSAQYEFVFVLTEFPDQHHRQWLRFQVNVFFKDQKKPDEEFRYQQFEVVVPGLPGSPRYVETKTVGYETTNNAPEFGVLTVDAPPVLIRRDKPPELLYGSPDVPPTRVPDVPPQLDVPQSKSGVACCASV